MGTRGDEDSKRSGWKDGRPPGDRQGSPSQRIDSKGSTNGLAGGQGEAVRDRPAAEAAGG